MEWIYKLDQVKLTAAQFWQTAGNARVFAFHGPMGMGKTTFIHALCDVKQVKDVVGSPTFSIINEYVYFEDSIEKKIFHIDLYRLKDAEEALQAGVEDCLYSAHICMIEWPEKISSHLPDGTAHVFIEAMDEQTRKLKIGDN
ncbi:MAG: tRNA (adenosine(37)-N6)-threonylcarbamoyltransferase complex ATPase subunit type 1 TsaE [Bacteroidia bacterium]|nr:tRNA (adenosine(37)-N6)-threonylcarbamoyltransferase complex ATPase subunit type 1 TsaE [Bacteroidia bacterium]